MEYQAKKIIYFKNNKEKNMENIRNKIIECEKEIERLEEVKNGAVEGIKEQKARIKKLEKIQHQIDEIYGVEDTSAEEESVA